MVINSKRKNINVATLEKVKKFLQTNGASFKSNIVKSGVDYNSVKLALEILKVKTNKDGRVRLR